jgi:predicted DNA-binding mobile mystery protein A
MFDLPFKQIKKALRSWKDIPSWLKSSIPFSKQIYMMRSALGMTQEQLAKRVRSSQRAVVRLEKGEVDPQLSTLKRIAESLNCELLVRFVPKTDLEKILREKAKVKAQALVKMSVASSNIELQKPSEKTIQLEIKRITEEILGKKRSSLWGV